MPPLDLNVEEQRTASLQRLLSEAVARGSARAVVGAFAEVLGVWNDIEVRGYVAGACGRFFQYVLPIDADPSAMPAELDEAAAPADTVIVRLSPPEAERLGFASIANDVLIRRIATETGASWLIVFGGSIDADDEASLVLCSDLLRESLNAVTAAATRSVVSAVMRHLEPLDEPVQSTAQLVLDEVVGAVEAHQGALGVANAAGVQALAVGNTDLLPPLEQAAVPDRVVVRSQSADHGNLVTLAVAREGHGFTAHDRDILEAVAAALHPWVCRALERFGLGERRRTLRPVHEQIERLAAETVRAGGQASVIMMTVRGVSVRPELMHTWVTKVRNQLRPWDFAGILSGSEIAVLVRDTPPDQVAAISARLKDLLQSDESAGVFMQAPIGMITCSEASDFAGSVVRAARDDVARRMQA